MPVQSDVHKPLSRSHARASDGAAAAAPVFARRRRDARVAASVTAWVAYKGRPAAKPASPPAEKAAPPKEAQPQAPSAPKPSEPAKEGGKGAA